MEDLEDQLFALMGLPRSPPRRRVLPKIHHLARQIKRTNLEFLETKVLDRAIIFNITTRPEKQAEPEQGPAQENEAFDSPTMPGGLFSVHNGGMFHNLGIHYTSCLQTTDHLGLVRWPDPLGPYLLEWAATYYYELMNTKLGYSKAWPLEQMTLFASSRFKVLTPASKYYRHRPPPLRLLDISKLATLTRASNASQRVSIHR